MKAVRAALDGRIELAAGRVTELGIELIGKQSKVLDGFRGNCNQRSRDRLVVVVDAFNCKVIVPWTLTSHRGANSISHRAAVGNTRAQQRKIQNTSACASCGGEAEILRILRIECRLQLRGGGVDRRRRARNFHGLAGCTRRSSWHFECRFCSVPHRLVQRRCESPWLSP